MLKGMLREREEQQAGSHKAERVGGFLHLWAILCAVSLPYSSGVQ
jgi:hypothetical protein